MDDWLNSLRRLPTIVNKDENSTVVKMIENIITEYFPLFSFTEPEANFFTAFLLIFVILISLPFIFLFTKGMITYKSYHIISEIFHF